MHALFTAVLNHLLDISFASYTVLQLQLEKGSLQQNIKSLELQVDQTVKDGIPSSGYVFLSGFLNQMRNSPQFERSIRAIIL